MKPIHPSRKVLLMGVINVSPESFYKGSVATKEKDLARKAKQLQRDGAQVIDVGAMSTAPYLKTKISEDEEARRLSWAVKIIRTHSRLPISIDTARAKPAQVGLKAGAQILNDVTGLSGDPTLLPLLKKFKCVILMANPSGSRRKLSKPVQDTKRILRKSIQKALKAGVPRSRIVIDPGIGFFRHTQLPWWKWDVSVLHNLNQLKSLGYPILIGVSRKSFIGHILGGVPPEERLEGSLAATLIGVMNGASMVRTHDVKETANALKLLKGASA